MAHSPMTKEAAQEWVDALEGPYADKKGIETLNDGNGLMCCLGVLADMRGDWDEGSIFTVGGEYNFPEQDSLELWGLTFEQGDVLAGLNDKSDTFAPVIAEIKRMFIDGVES